MDNETRVSSGFEPDMVPENPVITPEEAEEINETLEPEEEPETETGEFKEV